MPESCKVCLKSTKKLFSTTVLNKYNVQYFQCQSCGFIQTEDPVWLNEAYESAITQLDIGLVSRNIQFSGIVKEFFDKGLFNDKGLFLDYAGGYGLFVRMMRDLGFNYYRQDTYCKNIFAEHFDIKDLPENQTFEIITAFEVFEHLIEPRKELQKMLSLSEVIIFSTLLQPDKNLTPENWWYFTPQTGQHIALYSKDSLQALANEFDLNLYSNNINLHILTKKVLPFDPFYRKEPSIFQKISHKIVNKLRSKNPTIERESLTQKDYEYLKNLM